MGRPKTAPEEKTAGRCKYCGGKKTDPNRISCTDCYDLGLRYVYWEEAIKSKKPLNIDTSNFEKIESPLTYIPTWYDGTRKGGKAA